MRRKLLLNITKTLHFWDINTFSNEMFVRMLTVHCNQNDSYEITMNDQDRKINEIRDLIFGLQPSIKAKFWNVTKLSTR